MACIVSSIALYLNLKGCIDDKRARIEVNMEAAKIEVKTETDTDEVAGVVAVQQKSKFYACQRVGLGDF